jgi:hypothetical protein
MIGGGEVAADVFFPRSAGVTLRTIETTLRAHHPEIEFLGKLPPVPAFNLR